MQKAVTIGMGNLGGAVTERLHDQHAFAHITGIFNSKPGRLIQSSAFSWRQTLSEAALSATQEAQVVFIGVKPQTFPQLARDYAGHIAKDALVISLMAALDPAYLSKELNGAQVVWAMTNVAARNGEAMTALCPSANVSADNLTLAKKIAQNWGDIVLIPSQQVDQMHTYTASVGSGTAFVCRIVELLQEQLKHGRFFEEEVAAIEQGDTRTQAISITEQVLVEFTAATKEMRSCYQSLFTPLFSIAIAAAEQRSHEIANHLIHGAEKLEIPALDFTPATPLFASAFEKKISSKQIITALYVDNLYANEQAGFSAEDAAVMAAKTWEGALALLKAAPDKEIREIYKTVISPQGTTMAGLKAMEKELDKPIAVNM